MKRISLITILLIGLALIVTSSKTKKPIVQSDDFLPFITNAISITTTNAESDLEFWQGKLKQQPHSATYKTKVAGLLSKRFRAHGNINDLLESDRLLKSALNSKIQISGIYQALSANAITQHKFQEARAYAQKALKEGERKDVSYLMLFDANLELGDYELARAYLNQQQNKSSFDYLTRAAKLKDIEGDLDGAIQYMESAMDRVKSNPKLFIWSLSNLADMYGHAGKIKKSYDAYLQVLGLDPDHLHSLQGIAWIAFSHDQNTEYAKEILEHISTQKNSPDVLLALADIAEFEGENSLSAAYKEAFYDEATRAEYAGMYNKYIIELLTESFDQPQLALEKAKKEVAARANPLAYDLLAWTYLQSGHPEKALQIAKEHVENQSFEPEVIYHLGLIYKMNGREKQGRVYLKEALESAFELGPLTVQKIKQALIS